MTADTTNAAPDPSAPHEIELLSFRVEDHEYSVDIMSVREIRGWTRTTSLPHSPSYVRGVINLRGTVLPVIDLAMRLGMDPTEPDDRNVIIVIDVDGRTLGLRVDAVSDILTLPTEKLRSPPEIAADENQTFLRALTIIDERMVRVLDLSSIMPDIGEVAA
ncbi:chemotaxis protein CheW [Alphaproteobacteria bacterium GH1-50]|uniref:Chemotaxis protein CheW n=1 Tax=Kangsaoukella pontilimi TaxID=2691042 RepID=A0A7C9MPZ4_9RHOB|nr:chemotaxis protein CheW [Kangsaoukella pontilimi]MXQ06897.1 chemotaxis protein CheW [Kangsaoukella pontilimi]